MKNLLLPVWVISYVLLCTFLYYLLIPTVSYDAVEAFNWGANKDWGSPKNPWLVGFMMTPAIKFNEIPINFYWYLIHFIGGASGLAGVWCLTRYLSGNTLLAWIAMLSLIFSSAIGVDLAEYNDNYLLIMLWPWMFLFFVLAINNRPVWWIAFALAAGLATMAKYSTIAFVSAIFVITIIEPRIRVCYKSAYFYAAILLFVTICTPNFLWLLDHNFAAFRWVDSQVSSGINTDAALAYFNVFFPVLIACSASYFMGFRINKKINFQIRYTLYACLVPMLIIFIWLSLNSVSTLSALREWIQPLLFIAMPAIISLARIEKEPLAARGVIELISILALAIIGLKVPYHSGDLAVEKSQIPSIAKSIEKRWVEKYQSPLIYVGGGKLSHWMLIYAESRPSIATPWSSIDLPNIYNSKITEKEIYERGAIFFGESGVSCEHIDFLKMLEAYSSIKISDQEDWIIKTSEGKTNENFCIGFVSPQKT